MTQSPLLLTLWFKMIDYDIKRATSLWPYNISLFLLIARSSVTLSHPNTNEIETFSIESEEKTNKESIEVKNDTACLYTWRPYQC